MAVPLREVYRGYAIEVEPDGGGHYLSAKPTGPDLPILSHSRVRVLCSQARGVENLRSAVDRLLDKW